MEDYAPIIGKTYSLFGNGNSTSKFYQELAAMTDEMLEHFNESEKDLLEYIRSVSSKRRRLRISTRQSPGASKLAFLLNQTHEVLHDFTGNIDQHIRSVSVRKHITDKDLLTSREQYFLYMLEFELVNRLNRELFKKTAFKIALLPYCLKESHTHCKASPDEVDYQCKGCIKSCYINRIGGILRENGINPYILSRGRVRNLIKEQYARYGSIGVLGIACLVKYWSYSGDDDHILWFLLCYMLIAMGGFVQTLCIYVLSAYVGRTYLETKQRPPYIIEEVVGETGQL